MNRKDHVAVRLDEKTFARLDAVQAKMSEKAQVLGVILTQSDAIRAAIAGGSIKLLGGKLEHMAALANTLGEAGVRDVGKGDLGVVRIKLEGDELAARRKGAGKVDGGVAAEGADFEC